VNLYSTTLAVAIIKPKIPEWKLTVACGVIGTALAMIGITDYFIGFLEWLGVIVPPVASIYLTDYFVLKQKNYSLTLQDSLPDYDRAAIVAWVIGTAISAFTFVSEFSLSTIPTLDALVITAPIYLICRRLWPAKLQRSGVVN
jgi:cytosine permease